MANRRTPPKLYMWGSIFSISKLKSSASERLYINFSISRNIKGSQKLMWFNCTAFGDIATFIAERFGQGSFIEFYAVPTPGNRKCPACNKWGDGGVDWIITSLAEDLLVDRANDAELQDEAFAQMEPVEYVVDDDLPY